MERYDAVVIGSGPNGLAAAITLARARRSVLLLEAQPRLGGAVATAELTLPGFAHDVFSAVYPAAAASPVFSRMPLADHGLHWVQPAVAMAHPMPDGNAAALYPDLAATVDSLEALQPGDGRAWEAFATPYLNAIGPLRKVLLGGFPPVVPALRLAAALGLRQTLELARLLLLPADAFARELFRGAHATGWIFGSVFHGDQPPTVPGSAITGVYLHLLGHAVGWPSPRGGAGALVDALVGYLRSLDGHTRVNAHVERIVGGRGRVAGVITAAGDRIRADVVVADVTPHGLSQLAGKALPEDYRHMLERFRYGPDTIKVDWALDGPVPWSADAARLAGTVHVAGPAEEMVAAHRQLGAGELPDRPFVLFGQQSVADPTRTPTGGHTGWAYTRVPTGLDPAVHTDPHVDRMESQIERFAPGFRDRILARHVMGPADLERRDENLRGGDVGGGSYALDQLIFRPVPSLLPYRTPLRGLYLGSASAFPGGAVHGVPGAAAARYALAESRLPW
ncbi:MAG TPA: NAD(P)/FAD-dependent oxidoreductase [Euzebyales bacterium]|nr:NAD(P)/FAD-dependent oxidoreductase [Euzebyales bacterium]